MPNTLEPGFSKADSTNLPKISIFMTWEYIATNERYNLPEVRGVKATLSSRENYGDSAIGYVCVKRTDNICVVKGRICPEHRVRNKDYTVFLTVDETEGKIENVECLDCAASEGGCKHGIAFLMWCNRRHESASPTDVECYWKKSKLSQVGTSKKFITTAEMAKKDKVTSVCDMDSSTFLEKVLERAQEKQLDCQLTRYSFDLLERKAQLLSIHQLMFSFPDIKDSADDFLKHAEENMSEDLCKEGERNTQDQSNNVLWHELKFGRITASNIYESSRCQTVDGNLVHRIIGVAKVYDNKHMERGRKLEDAVIAEIQKTLKLQIKKSGIILKPSIPVLGASPDSIGSDFILEIKCPSSEKTVADYLPNGNISKKCKGQINLQMLAAGKSKGLFVVADPEFETNKQFKYLWLDYDAHFTNTMIERALNFWKQNIFPILLQSFRK
ncbi:uncharacterized protein LOC143375179 [Andrena cerasifolii]|uniref:uncharacterized protein LOC143366795 n=1 Tax=Andrena cerasifolii TaxID=2819439 RepID=UPI0040377F8C